MIKYYRYVIEGTSMNKTKTGRSKKKSMSLHTLSYILIFAGAVLAAFGALGSNYFGKRESKRRKLNGKKDMMNFALRQH